MNNIENFDTRRVLPPLLAKNLVAPNQYPIVLQILQKHPFDDYDLDENSELQEKIKTIEEYKPVDKKNPPVFNEEHLEEVKDIFKEQPSIKKNPIKQATTHAKKKSFSASSAEPNSVLTTESNSILNK